MLWLSRKPTRSRRAYEHYRTRQGLSPVVAGSGRAHSLGLEALSGVRQHADNQERQLNAVAVVLQRARARTGATASVPCLRQIIPGAIAPAGAGQPTGGLRLPVCLGGAAQCGSSLGARPHVAAAHGRVSALVLLADRPEERWQLWRPLDTTPGDETCYPAASMVHRWLDRAGMCPVRGKTRRRPGNGCLSGRARPGWKGTEMAKWFVAIAGNIGVGKSALTELLSQHLGWEPFYEAVTDNPYLEDFYRDMKRYAFHSQVFFLCRRLRHHQKLLNLPGSVVQDRSIYEDAEIFARALYEQGYIVPRDYRTYRELYEVLVQFLPPPDLLVYLQASVPTLLNRIALRGRPFEQSITPEYLGKLNELYESWLQHFSACPVLTVPTDDLDFVHNGAHLNLVIDKIQENLSTQKKQ